MKETQQKIKEYQEKLPRVKEKIFAVLLLLAISTSMLITVSFAWVSLSTSPALIGVNTSIASNGNLEIALASGSAMEPNAVAPSAAGDTNLPLLERNITWGNLINLSDPAYGLDSLVLRPALLNDSNLLQRPLRGPIYDATGRVVDMNTNFGYAKQNDQGVFVSTNDLGIRAITYMKLGETGERARYFERLEKIAGQNAILVTDYQNLADNQNYMNALSAMMAGYIVENIFYTSTSDTVLDMLEHQNLEKTHVQQFQYMYYDMFLLMMEQARQTVDILNLNADIQNLDIEITVDELLALPYHVTNKTAYNELKRRGYTTVADSSKTVTLLKEIDQFLADFNVIVEDHERLGVLYNSMTSDSIAWLDSMINPDTGNTRLIDDIISRLVNLGSCTMANYNGQSILGVGGNQPPTRIDVAKDSGSILSKYVMGGPCDTKITNGILLRFDNRTGGRIANDPNSTLKISLSGQTVNTNVSTTADDNYFENERAYLFEAIGGAGMAMIAQDVYGFAVDFWVRTNAQGSFLTLQGNVLTRTETKEVFDKNREGQDVPIYTITVVLEEGATILDRVTASYDIYQSTKVIEVVNEETGEVTEETVDCWRYAKRHAVVEDEYVAEYVDGKLPPRKVETIKVAIGYEGDNRVWEGDEHTSLTVNSSTQGSGSCYVFYSDNPVDQARIKKLLESMKVAFVDDQGELLAKASMNVKLSYESTGKVIVPLVLDDDSINLGKKENGDNLYAITALERNVAKRITAIFYLDGETITNSEVLASSDIRGQMNIQFGSSVMLKPMGNDPLYNSEIYMEAELVGNTSFEYGVDQNMTTKVKVRIDGIEPSKVEAFFVRKINESQGSQEQVFTLLPTGEEGVYEGEYTFRYPGEYILRSVRVDGTDRDLQLEVGETYPTVMVNGYSITSVRYQGVVSGTRILTDASSYSITSELEFAADDPSKMPGKVAGQFLREDGAVATVNYTYDATDGVWRGKATFTSSGEYTMQFVMLDGKYTELSEVNRCTVDLTLGMRVNVTTLSPTTFAYDPDTMPEALYMRVQILDNNGEAVKNVTGARLYYAASGSSELYTDLTWNDSTEMYNGMFDVQAGIWRFSRVIVYAGEQPNVLRAVNSNAPVFTIIPPTPPSYYSNTTGEAQFVRTGNGSVTVTLKDSSAATVYAKFIRSDSAVARSGGEVRYVKANDNPVQTGEDRYTYTFELDSGIWDLVSVSAFNVIDGDMNMHALPVDANGEAKAVETEDEYNSGMVFAFESEKTAVLKQSHVSVNIQYTPGTFNTVVSGSTQVGRFGTTSTSLEATNVDATAAFMDSHKIPQGAMTVTLSDPYGLLGSVFTIKDVSMYYDFEGIPAAKYGGYTTTESVWGTFSPGKITLTAGAQAGSYTNEKDIIFQYAGRYAVENASGDKLVDYTLTWTGKDGSTQEVTASKAPTGAYAVEVYSKAPSVYISDITMDGAGAYAVDEFDTAYGSISDNHTQSTDSSAGCIPDTVHDFTLNTQHKTAAQAQSLNYISRIENGGLTAYLYFKCSHDGKTPYQNKGNGATADYHEHVYNYNDGSGVPAATLTLSNMGSATNAKLFFKSTGGTDGNVYMIKQYTQDSGKTTYWGDFTNQKTDFYEWTSSSLSCMRFIGFMDNGAGENGSDTKTVAKTIQADTLVMTYNGMEFSFTVPTVTIHNPY